MLLVFGGSQGARTLNKAVAAALPALAEPGIAVLHAHGPKNAASPPPRRPGTSRCRTWSDMDLAYAAADVGARAGPAR